MIMELFGGNRPIVNIGKRGVDERSRLTLKNFIEIRCICIKSCKALAFALGQYVKSGFILFSKHRYSMRWFSGIIHDVWLMLFLKFLVKGCFFLCIITLKNSLYSYLKIKQTQFQDTLMGQLSRKICLKEKTPAALIYLFVSAFSRLLLNCKILKKYNLGVFFTINCLSFKEKDFQGFYFLYISVQDFKTKQDTFQISGDNLLKHLELTMLKTEYLSYFFTHSLQYIYI